MQSCSIFFTPKVLLLKKIGEISDAIYGRTYSKQQVSYLSTNCREDVEQWLNRRLSSYYLAIYIDATFITTRRDKQVSKEAYYTILGVLEDGSREMLSVVNHPTEGAICWKEELEECTSRNRERCLCGFSSSISSVLRSSRQATNTKLCLT